MPDGPLIRLASLYERVGQRGRGRKCLVGYLGHAKLLIFHNPNAGEDEPDWTAFLAARPERKDDA